LPSKIEGSEGYSPQAKFDGSLIALLHSFSALVLWHFHKYHAECHRLFGSTKKKIPKKLGQDDCLSPSSDHMTVVTGDLRRETDIAKYAISLWLASQLFYTT